MAATLAVAVPLAAAAPSVAALAESVKTGNHKLTVEQGNREATIQAGNDSTKVSAGKSNTEAMQSIELTVGGIRTDKRLCPEDL